MRAELRRAKAGIDSPSAGGVSLPRAALAAFASEQDVSVGVDYRVVADESFRERAVGVF